MKLLLQPRTDGYKTDDVLAPAKESAQRTEIHPVSPAQTIITAVVAALLVFLGLGSQARAAGSGDCLSLDGLDDPKIPSSRGLYLGEIHGTREAPEFFIRMLCHLSKAGRPVAFAMEYPSDQQEKIDQYLQSDGGQAAKQEFLRSKFWSVPPERQDGLRSQAMLSVFEYVRQALREGRRIRIVAYMATRASAEASGNPYQANAQLLERFLDSLLPREYALITGGNVHARKTALKLPDGSTIEPEGLRLAGRGLLHLNMSHGGGATWKCDMEQDDSATPRLRCGEWRLNPSVHSPAIPKFSISFREGIEGFDGLYGLGVVSASSPAIGVQ